MSIRKVSLITAMSVAVMAFAACGGPDRPGPLKHHFEEMFLAKIPIEQKRSVLDADQDYERAKMELYEARQEYEESVTAVTVAKNEAEKAKLEAKSVKAKHKAAEKAGDLTQINETALLLRSARLMHKAAQKKVSYAGAHRQYLRVNVDYKEDLMYQKKAEHEMSMALMAQNHNIQPRGFVMANFERQSENRNRWVEVTRARLDKALAKAEQRKEEWKALENEARMAEFGAAGAGGNTPPPPNNFNDSRNDGSTTMEPMAPPAPPPPANDPLPPFGSP